MESTNIPPTPEEQPARAEDATTVSKGKELANKAQEAYKWWDNLATFHAEDPWWLGGLKILVRVIGIFIMLLLSPFLILVLLIAVMVAA